VLNTFACTGLGTATVIITLVKGPSTGPALQRQACPGWVYCAFLTQGKPRETTIRVSTGADS